MTVVLAALGQAISLIPASQSVTTESGSTTAISGFSGADSLYAEVSVERIYSARAISPTLSLLIEQSTDGNSWSTAASFTFGDDGSNTATISSPSDYLRVSWSVADRSHWAIKKVQVTPQAVNQGSSSAMTLLSTTTLSVDGTFDVSSISQAYNDLMAIVIARGTNASAFDSLRIRFNNVSTNTYGSQQVNGNITTVAAEQVFSTSSGWANEYIPAASATANRFGYAQILIPGYASTTWTKQWAAHTPLAADETNGGMLASVTCGVWNSTAAISRIQLFGGTTANLLTGSTLRIYGIT